MFQHAATRKPPASLLGESSVQEWRHFLTFSDFQLILQKAMEASVPMPATAAAVDVCASEHARSPGSHSGEDFSFVIQGIQQVAEGPAAVMKNCLTTIQDEA